MNASKHKIILDCDAGTDDAQALLMALAQPDVQLIAVMAVLGTSSCANTAKNCLRILKFKNRLDIPVYKGSDKTLLARDLKTGYHGRDGLGDIQIEGVDPVDLKLLQKEHASLALVKLVNENPGQITLVATGPLTNIAIALHIDPELGSKIRDFYVMGGNTEGRGNVTPSAEFNFHSDPDAAHFVLNSFGKPINLCSMEVCERHGFSWEWYEKYTSGETKTSKLVHDFLQTLVTREKELGTAKSFIMVWDQVTMAAAINKDVVVKTQDVYATVELHGMHTRGSLVIDWTNELSERPNVRLILELNQALFGEMMRTIIKD